VSTEDVEGIPVEVGVANDDASKPGGSPPFAVRSA
jgi:hypothetical protein